MHRYKMKPSKIHVSCNITTSKAITGMNQGIIAPRIRHQSNRMCVMERPKLVRSCVCWSHREDEKILDKYEVSANGIGTEVAHYLDCERTRIKSNCIHILAALNSSSPVQSDGRRGRRIFSIIMWAHDFHIGTFTDCDRSPAFPSGDLRDTK